MLLSGADLNVAMTVSYYETSATRYTDCAADAQIIALLPITFPGFELTNIDIYSAGNARPTSNTGGASQHWCEPLLAPFMPQIAETGATDSNTLSLTSYVPGKATIRVEEAG